MKLLLFVLMMLIVSNLVCDQTYVSDFSVKYLEIYQFGHRDSTTLRATLKDTYELIKEYPNEILAYFVAADLLKDLKQYNDGINLLTQSINLNIAEYNLQLFRRRMILYELNGNGNLAEKDWISIKSLQTESYGDTLTLISLYMHRKEPDNALSLINELLKTDIMSTSYFDGLHFRAKLYFEQEQYLKSIALLDSLIYISDEMDNVIPFELFFLYKSINFYRLDRLEELEYNFKVAVNIYKLMQKIIEEYIQDTSQIEYLYPYEGLLSDFDISSFEDLGDITELDSLISNECMEMIREIYSLLVNEEKK